MTTVGFTGTRKRMTEAQAKAVSALVTFIVADTGRHGDCVGADEQFHKVCRSKGLFIIGHLPVNDRFRAFCQFDNTQPPKGYLPRNRDIVDSSRVMIAAPGEPDEQLRSGTWSTIRYTRKIGKKLYAVFPDGSVAEEG